MFPPIAQLVEQLPLKEMVPGSSPGGRTDDLLVCREWDSAKNTFFVSHFKKFLGPARATQRGRWVPRAHFLVSLLAKTVIAQRHALGSTVLVPGVGLEPTRP